MDLSYTEENYLKTIYSLSYLLGSQEEKEISTNEIAKKIHISAASVSDMLKKLAQKSLIHYIKYQGVTLTEEGKKRAIELIRKHRLWETFLFEKLRFTWDEVHEIAEQLEHIQSKTLITKLDEFLGFPKVDPHGDPIPNHLGEFEESKKRIELVLATPEKWMQVIAVKDNTPIFLQYLDKLQISIGSEVKILEKNGFDSSLELMFRNQKKLTISEKVAANIYVIYL